MTKNRKKQWKKRHRKKPFKPPYAGWAERNINLQKELERIIYLMRHPEEPDPREDAEEKTKFYIS